MLKIFWCNRLFFHSKIDSKTFVFFSINTTAMRTRKKASVIKIHFAFLIVIFKHGCRQTKNIVIISSFFLLEVLSTQIQNCKDALSYNPLVLYCDCSFYTYTLRQFSYSCRIDHDFLLF